MSENEAMDSNFQLLTQAKKEERGLGILAHGRYEECQVEKISWDDMEDRITFRGKNKVGWNVGLPAITIIKVL